MPHLSMEEMYKRRGPRDLSPVDPTAAAPFPALSR